MKTSTIILFNFFRFFITIIIFLSFNISFAQNKNDNLKDSLKKYLYNDISKATKHNNSLLKLSKANNNIEDIKLAYAFAAIMHELQNNIDSTLFYYHKGLSFAKEPKSIYNFKYTIAAIHEKNYNYSKALQLYTQCLELAKKEKLIEDILRVETTMVNLKNKINNTLKSITFLEERYEKEKINDPSYNIQRTRKKLTEAYIRNSLGERALVLCEEGIRRAKRLNNIEYLHYFKNLEAQGYLQTNQIDLAQKAIKVALQNAKALNNKEFINEANFTQARIHINTNKALQAVNLLKEIFNDSSKKSSEQLSKYFKLTAESYKLLDSLDLSNLYYQKLYIEKEKASKKNISTLENIHEINLNQEVQEKEKLEQIKGNWTIAFLTLLILGLLLFFWYRIKQKQNQKLFDDLLLRVKSYEEMEQQLDIDNILSKLSNQSSKKSRDIDQEDGLTKQVNEKIKNESKLIIDKDTVVHILKNMKALEKEKYYLKQECTLHNMAKKINTNTTYLSKVTNKHLNKSFSSYINDLRINYAIVELKNNKRLSAYSVLAIAKELGYKNADSFSKYFKIATGITPSVYIRKIKGISKLQQ